MAASSAACPTATLDDAAMTHKVCWFDRSHSSARKARLFGMSCRLGFASSLRSLSTRKYASEDAPQRAYTRCVAVRGGRACGAGRRVPADGHSWNTT
jgi:hypothetical protein